MKVLCGCVCVSAKPLPKVVQRIPPASRYRTPRTAELESRTQVTSVDSLNGHRGQIQRVSGVKCIYLNLHCECTCVCNYIYSIYYCVHFMYKNELKFLYICVSISVCACMYMSIYMNIVHVWVCMYTACIVLYLCDPRRLRGRSLFISLALSLSQASFSQGFTKNMKLEAVNPRNPRELCVASVVGVRGRLLWLHLEGRWWAGRVLGAPWSFYFPPESFHSPFIQTSSIIQCS